MSKIKFQRRKPGIVAKICQLLLLNEVSKTVFIDGAQMPYFAEAAKIQAKQESGMIKIPIQKQAVQLAQTEAQTIGKISLDKVSMPLDNMWNFAYIGEFFLGSDEPQ